MKRKFHVLKRWLALTLAGSLICTLVPNINTMAAPGSNTGGEVVAQNTKEEPWIATPYVNEKGEEVEGLQNAVDGKRHWLETDEPLPVQVTEENGSLTIGNGIIQRRFQVPKEGGTEFFTKSFKNLYIDKEMMDTQAVMPDVYLGLYDKPYDDVYSDAGIKIHRDSIASADNTIEIPESSIKVDPDYYYVGGKERDNTFVFDGYTITDSCEKPFEWTSNKIFGDPASKEWPPKGKHLEFNFSAPESFPESYQGIKIKIIYEMYDNIPAMKKRVEIVNEGDSRVMIGRLAPEVIKGNENMEDLMAMETTFTCGDQSTLPINRPLPCKCDLEKDASPFKELKDVNHTCYEVGPAYGLEKGESMIGFDTYEFVHSTYWFELKMRERLGIYRTLFPWTTDNPLTHHNTGKLTKEVIDKAAEAEFEMIIQSYSAPDESQQMLSRNQATLDKYKELVDYAHSKGIAIGIYQAQYTRGQYAQSKEYGTNAEGQWGASMCLASAAFDDYWDNFKNFVKYTGLDCVEIDGTYPGNYCNCGEQHVNKDRETDPADPQDTATGDPSKYKVHNGVFDSVVMQWENGVRMMCAEFRDMGVFVKVPAWYYLNGANKCGIGYEEAGWSQPRQEQLLYGRQLMHNASYGRTMSMSWSHVPFAEYHGGGGDAAFQPFKEKKEDYNWVIAQNIGNGVNSDFRGPALFDDGTQDILNKWVEFYKRYRGIVNSDMVHISQAAYDAAGTNRKRGVKMDTLYHVNALNEGEKGLLWVYNQTDEARTEVITVPMYYTGLAKELNYPPVPLKNSLGKNVHRYGAYPPNYDWIPKSEGNYRQPDVVAGDYGQAVFMQEGVQQKVLSIDSNGNAQLEVTLPPMSFTYYSVYDSKEAPEVSLEVGKVTGLKAQEPTENSVVLDWDKDVTFKMIEDGNVIDKPTVTVDSYMVYRDGELIAKTMENTYKDTSLTEQKDYVYTVKAVAKGIEGSLSEPLTISTKSDHNAPLVTKVEAKSNTTIEIVFSEEVDSETAANIDNYHISEGIQVKSAKVEKEKIILTIDALSMLKPYTLKIENVCDASEAKNPMEAHEQKIIYGYIAKFGFEKASEGQITDAFGNYTGKASYMETLDQTYGSSARLKEEKTSYGNLGSGLLKGLDQYSMSIWFKTESEKKQILLSQGQEGKPEDDLTLAAESGRLSFHAGDADGNEVALEGGTILSGKWNQAVVVRDGQSFTLYLNGEAVDTKKADIGVNDTQNALLVGAMKNNAGGDRVGYFSGDLSEISIYNVPLGQEDITLLEQSGLVAFSAAADSAKSLDESLYTEESYKVLKDIIAEINNMDSAGMVPSEIVDVIKRLKEAMNSLQLTDSNKFLKALYHMDEEKGEIIANGVQGSNATFVNGEYMRMGTPFKRGAYLYENLQNYIAVPDSPIADLDTFTVSGWFKPQLFLENEVTDTVDETTQVRGTPKQVLLSDKGSNLVLSLQKRKLVLEITDGEQIQTITAPDEFAMEQMTGGESRQAWNHFAIVRTEDMFTLYMNGNKMGEISLAGVNIGESLTIGAKLNQDNVRELQYNGLVDEFAFYSSALEQSDISAAASAIPFRKSARENIALKKTLNSDGMTDPGRINDGKVLDYAGKDTPWSARSSGATDKLKYQIDLGALYDIDTISLTQFFRNYNNEELRRFRDVVIQISTKNDFAPENTTTILNTDADNSMGLGAGKDQTFYSFELGNDFILNEPVQGRYVRLFNSGFYNLNGDYSGYVNVSEMEVYGTKSVTEPAIKISAEDVDVKVVGDREFVKVTADSDTNLADLIIASTKAEVATAKWSTADGLQINGLSKGKTDITLTHPKDNTLTKTIHVTVEGLEPKAIINDNDQGITYTGSFTYYSGRGGDPDGVTEYSRDIHHGNTTGDTAEYTFTGTGIDVVTTVNIDGGLVGVTIDNKEYPDINTAIPNGKYFKRANQMCVFSVTDLSPGEHTIRLENKTFNITVDAFRIYEDVDAGVNKEALKKMLEEAKEYKPDGYTKESFDKLQAAIEEARLVFESEDASQEEVNDQADKLDKAIKQLKPVEAGKKPLIWFDMETLDGSNLTNHANDEAVAVTGNPKLEKGRQGQSALRLDGDTYIDLGTSFQPEQDYTLMGWIKQDTGATDGQAFVSRSYSSVIKDQLGVMLKNGSVIHEVSFKKGNENTDYQAITSPGNAPQGRWNHIAVIRTGSTVNIYINGVLAVSQDGLSEDAFAPNSKNFYIGRDCDKSGVPYNQHAYRGLMDDLRLYDVALGKEEITEIYESCRSGFVVEELSNGTIVLKLEKEPQSVPVLSDFTVEFKEGDKYLPDRLTNCEYNSETKQVTLTFDKLENHTQGDKLFTISILYLDELLSKELTVPSAGDNQIPTATAGEVINLSKKLGTQPRVKGMLKVSYEFQDPDGDPEGDTKYQWYGADAIDGEYTPIQGMHTPTIILLDQYVGKYLKCEVIPADCYGNVGESSISEPTGEPVQSTEGNPLTDWMYEAGYGVSHHFLSNYFNLSHVYANPEEKWDRSKMTWNEFVGQFDAEAYAKEINDTGAKFVILTLGQNSGSYCAPNQVYDQYMREAGLLKEGEANPKTVSMENDLPMKIADALEQYNIELMLYLPSNPPHSASWDETGTPNGYGYFSDYLVTKKVFDYTPGTDGVPNQRSRKVLSEMVEWWSQHYGDKISGWWFDGCYPGGVLESQMDMSLEYNLSTLANAAKAGNPYSIVTFNQGLSVDWAFNKSNPYQDYTAGESQGMDTFPVEGRWAKDSTDCQNFMFGPIGNRNNWSAGWGCSGTSRTEEFMINAIKTGMGNQYAMGFDTKVNALGHLDPDQYKQLVTLKNAIRGEEEQGADLTQLRSLYHAVSNMDLSIYTEASAGAVNDALIKADTILKKDNPTKEEAADAESELLVALAGLEKEQTEPKTDKSLAQALYDAYKDLNLSGYTKDSGANFTKALKALEKVIGNEEATQEEVNDAIAELLSAATALEILPDDPQEPEVPVDFTLLNVLYHAYADIDTTKYTKESADAFHEALLHAKEVMENTEADQEAVNQAAGALAKAAAELIEAPQEPEVVVDTSVLRVLRNAYADLDTTKYTKESADAFHEALLHAEEILKDEKADQAAVDKAAEALAKAVAELIEAVEDPVVVTDTSVLRLLYQSYKGVDTSKYTAQSAEVLLAALRQAESVLNDGEADQATVNQAVEVLAKAVAELTQAPAKPVITTDTSTLRVLYQAFAELDITKYTDNSAKKLKDALAQALVILNNGEATQVQIDQAAARLMSASAGLELKPAEAPKPDAPKLKKGQILTYKGLKYKVTNPTPGKAEVMVTGASNRNLKKVTVPSTVTLKGIKCKVTQIGEKAFRNYKKLQQITIGANVTTIGKQAFYGDGSLKSIIVKSTKLKSVSKDALKGISSKAVIKVPKSKVKTYKKVFKNKGQKSSVVIK